MYRDFKFEKQIHNIYNILINYAQQPFFSNALNRLKIKQANKNTMSNKQYNLKNNNK